MVNTRSTKYEVADELNDVHSTYSDETDSCVSDNDSEYVPSDSESENDASDIERLNVATTLLSLKNTKCKKEIGSDSDSDSDYEPGDESDEDCYVGGVRNLRGMPAPCGVHIRFD